MVTLGSQYKVIGIDHHQQVVTLFCFVFGFGTRHEKHGKCSVNVPYLYL